MRKLLPKTLIVFLAIWLISIFISKLLPWESYTAKIKSSFKAQFSYDIMFDTIKGSILPFPHLIIENVKIHNLANKKINYLATIEKAEFSIPFNFIWSSNFNINNVKITKGNISFQDFISDSNFISKLNDKSLENFNIELVNCTLDTVGNSDSWFNGGEINNLKLSSNSSQISLDSNIHLNEEKINFMLSLDRDSKFQTNITADNFSIAYKGNYLIKDKDYNFTGDLTSNINSLNVLLSLLNLPITNIPLKQSDKISLISKLTFDNNNIDAQNITINSKSINGKGDFKKSLRNSSQNKFNFIIDDISLDNLSIAHNKDQASSQDTYNLYLSGFKSLFNLILPDIVSDTDINISFTANNINYSGAKISKITVNANNDKGALKIHDTELALDPNNIISVNGNITNNGFRNIFIGNVNFAIDGNNDAIKPILSQLAASGLQIHLPSQYHAYFLATSKELDIYQICKNQDSDGLTSNVNLVYGNRKPRFTLELNSNKSDMTNYVLPDLANYDLAHFMKFDWLRDFQYDINIDANLANLAFKENFLNQFEFGLNITRGMLNINNINLRSNFADFQSNIAINTKYINPKLDITLNGKMLNLLNLFKDSSPNNKNSLSDKDFYKLPVEQLDGKIEVNLEEFQSNGSNFKDLALKSDMLNGVLFLEKFKFNLFHGDFSGYGSVALNPLNANMSFAYNNFLVQPLLESLFAIDDLSGYGSLAGSLRTKGTSPAKLISNLEAKLSIATREVTIKNLNLDEFPLGLTDISYAANPPNDLKVKALTKAGSFSNIDGQFQISKGVMSSSNTHFNSQYTQGISALNINLNNNTIALSSNFVFLLANSPNTITYNYNCKGTFDKLEKNFQF